jgi:NADH dehydrogenase
VISGWLWSFFLGRDTTQLMDLDNPRGAFVAAATPAPKPAAAPEAAKPEAKADPQTASKESVPADAK